MMEIMWILAAFLPFLTEGSSNDKGTNQNTTVASISLSAPHDVKNRTFKLGSDANLSCSSRTWNETMYVIWKITLTTQNKNCSLGFISGSSSQEPKVDTCLDGKSLRNSSSGQSYLHIPNFSENDVGMYKCESVYRGGNEVHDINVDIIVPPRTSMWLEPEGEKMVAVCRAERGKPAANISWSQDGSPVETLLEHAGFFTLESRLELLEGTDTENLTCFVNHPYWRDHQILRPQLKKGNIPWIIVITVVSAVVLLGGILICVQKKRIVRFCQRADTSQPKSAPIEEVEPYASYVQRVNSLYNSTADMFT